MLRTHTCGELTIRDTGKNVTLCGWVQGTRDLGGMTFVDLRDRYGITQLLFNMDVNPALCERARTFGREFVVSATGKVTVRSNKNPKMVTGDIEIEVEELEILNASKTPPFTVEEQSDGGDDLRMKFRFIDLRRTPVQKNIILRHCLAQEVRNYFNKNNFLEIETPFLIKSTPEGARDFIVPSRMNPGQFYALPQSPQIFKQLLMVSGYDRYYQIVRCFRDEDLRADRQPEFTQIDCEMSFVTREDTLFMFEGMMKHLFRTIKNIELPDFPRINYDEAMAYYGTDKPDLRFGMKIEDITELVKGKGFKILDEAEFIGGICATGCSEYSRKQLDELTEYVKRPQIGAGGLIYVKFTPGDTVKSSVDKFYSADDLKRWGKIDNAKEGDLLLILAGKKVKTLKALSELRLEMGRRLNLMDREKFSPLWVINFPLFEWDEETQRWYAVHHPFTAPNPEDAHFIEGDPGRVRANAYDMVINGIELGGGSIRIHSRNMQERIFRRLGFSETEAQEKFGFLMKAFEFGAPPHGGIAFGFDRICALFGGSDSIRDFIAFPKNNAARDMMTDAPAQVTHDQLKELSLEITHPC
ncbi:MAG: aspartate--tRNA ligase [Bacteroidetes bacterium]|nr:aspartate--tRNA ligase [Bacteroidota bacterium]